MVRLEQHILNTLDTKTLRITPGGSDKQLQRSLKEHGLLSPLRICVVDNAALLADGFRRMEALLNLGIESAPCLIAELSNIEEARLYSTRLRFADKEATAVEKAAVFSTLQQEGSKKKEILRAAGIPENEEALLLFLNTLPAGIQTALHATGITLKQLRNIRRLGEPLSRKLLVDAAMQLRLNANQIRRALALAADIRLSGRDPAPLLTPSLEEQNPAAAAKRFFDALEEVRRPYFTAREKRFNSLKAAFPGIRIGHHNFDDEQFDFSFTAGSIKEISTRTALLNSSEQELAKLFSLLGPDT